jgi:hypothetical protein
MANKPNHPQPADAVTFDCCDGGTFLIHKLFLSQLVDGIKAAQAATGARQGDFVKFSVSVKDPKTGLMKPSLDVKKGTGKTGKEENFTFTLDLFIPPGVK